MPPKVKKKLKGDALRRAYNREKNKARKDADDLHRRGATEFAADARAYQRKLVEWGVHGYAYKREHGDFPPGDPPQDPFHDASDSSDDAPPPTKKTAAPPPKKVPRRATALAALQKMKRSTAGANAVADDTDARGGVPPQPANQSATVAKRKPTKTATKGRAKTKPVQAGSAKAKPGKGASVASNKRARRRGAQAQQPLPPAVRAARSRHPSGGVACRCRWPPDLDASS